MCLTMGSEQCKPQIPPNLIKPESKKWQMIMAVMGIIHFCIAFMMMFLWIEKGFYELYDVMILFCACARMDYCCLVFYVLYIFIGFF